MVEGIRMLYFSVGIKLREAFCYFATNLIFERSSHVFNVFRYAAGPLIGDAQSQLRSALKEKSNYSFKQGSQFKYNIKN